MQRAVENGGFVTNLAQLGLWVGEGEREGVMGETKGGEEETRGQVRKEGWRERRA